MTVPPSRSGARPVSRPGRRLRKRRPDPLIRIIVALLCVSLMLVLIAVGAILWRFAARDAPAASHQPQAAETASPAPSPSPSAAPSLRPALVTGPPLSQPPEESPPGPSVDPDVWLADAVFIGDSRTDGLRLYSGIQGADFYCYKGLTIFEVDERKIVELNGSTYSVVEALEKGPQYAKIYISLGVNELGYYNDDAYHQAFSEFLDTVKALQPDAIIYLENLVPVNPQKCAEYKQPYYVNNDRVAAYNAIYPQLATEHQVALLDVASALSDENGILPADATADGVHFTKAWYQKWLAYLMNHTVSPEEYEAGQTAAEGA